MDYQQRETLLLAPYAMQSADSAGRVHDEPSHPYRSPYQRDRDRIVHSSAYRRLAHKTQVFTGEMGDYHRTRLTHTQEVASIARTLARSLRLNEDLVEALALAHDIGHPPFGHAGEDLLNERLEDQGGFNHNRQAVRLVTLLEKRYPQFAGLNLSHEMLDGQRRRTDKRFVEGNSPLLEVQIVDAADSIAYDAHDADDALELGILELEELAELELWREALDRVRARYTNLTQTELRRATIHELLDWQVGDLLSSVRALLIEHQIFSTADVRRAPPLAVASGELAEQKRQLESFLFARVYRHPKVLASRMEATAALGDLFDRLVADPTPLLTKPGNPFAEIAATDSTARAVADYLGCLTDHAALEEHSRMALI